MPHRPHRRRPSGSRAVVLAIAGGVAATEGAKVAAGMTAAPSPAQAGLLFAVVVMSGLLAWIASPEQPPSPAADKKCLLC